MKKILGISLVAVALLPWVASDSGAAGKEKIKPSVTYATTWEAAIEEAKLLNVPIVLHSHGFY